MPEDNTTDAVNSGGESVSDEDNALIKSLREQIKEKDKALKAVPSRSDIEAEIRASVAREKAIESELVALKLPAGLSETVEGKLGDADVTAEAVVEALKAIGFEITDSADGASESEEAAANASNLAQVADLSSQVNAAAKGGGQENLQQKINEAKSMAEVTALMAEAGLAN